MTDIPPVQPPQSPPVQRVAIAPTPEPGSGMATGALITGVASLIPAIGVILGVVAIILSGLVLHRKRPGRTMAVAGLTAGILGILLNCLSVGAAWYVATQRAMPLAMRAMCQARLSTYATGAIMYGNGHKGQFPPNVAAMNQYIGLVSLTCPSRKNPQPGRVDYVYVPPAKRVDQVADPAATILICDLKGNHRHGRNVAFVDGHLEWVTEDEFRDLLARPDNAVFAAGLEKIEGPKE